jgi:hypothetical protein
MQSKKRQRRMIVNKSDDDDNFIVSDSEPLEYDSDVGENKVSRNLQRNEFGNNSNNGNNGNNDTNETIVKNRKPLLDRFREALCMPDELESLDFYNDLILCKLAPGLTRGHKTNSKRLDDLIKFIYSEQFEERELAEDLEATCDLCLLRRTLSAVFTNGHKHMVVGATCATNLRNTKKIIDTLDKLRKEFQTFTETRFEEFMRMTDGIVEPVRYN